MAEPTLNSETPERIVVVHGLAANRLVMYPLCWRLRRAGYRVPNWAYPSFTAKVKFHAQRLRDFLREECQHESRVHLLAHSLGSIVVRTALAIEPPPNLGRVVFLAPPNQGTPLARRAGKIVGRYIPIVGELSDRPDSFVKRLPTSLPTDLGVIAARFDLLVPVANTHLEGEKEHVVLNATHNSLLVSGKVVRLACSFFKTGKFCTSP